MVQARLISQKNDKTLRFSIDKSVRILLNIKPGYILEVEINRMFDKNGKKVEMEYDEKK